MIMNGIGKEAKKVLDVYKQRKYITQAKLIDIRTGKRIVVLNEKEAVFNDIYEGQRVEINVKGTPHIVLVNLSRNLVKEGEIGLYADVSSDFGIIEGDILEISHVPMPKSLETIIKKINGQPASKEDIDAIIVDLMANKLSEPELAAWLTASSIRGMNDDEIVALTESMVASGDTLKLGKSPVVDKHCIGGVAGNRTTMILVPIIASAGIFIPKTSSRAITSPAGTADTMEVLAPVNITMEETREIVKKTFGVIVWGGGINIAPADDKMIKIRRSLRMDPKGVLLASILAKKKAVGSEHVLIDVPLGINVKVGDMGTAQDLAKEFKTIGERLGMNVGVVVTNGSEPIGNGMGPALEARDVISVLEGKGPSDLREKSLMMAGKIFELCGKVGKGEGYEVAKHFLESGKAIAKMREIIEAQGGDPNVNSDSLPVAKYTYAVKATAQGRIEHIDNRSVSRIARATGAPMDKAAGMLLRKAKGDMIKEGDVLFELFAESEANLDFALKMAEEFNPVMMGKVLLDEF
jgi:AMP phosphorylase